jgi:hypothetical protein
MTEFSRTAKQTPYTGNEGFSQFMYKFRVEANNGFTFIDIDTILRNYEKQTFALLEIKCRQANLSYAQKKIFNEMDEFLKRGSCCGWTYIGFYLLQFEGTSFDDGAAWLNGQLITADEFKTWLKINF